MARLARSERRQYANPAYDVLYQQQSRELDQQRRQALVWQMQKIVFTDVVYMVPYYAQAAQAYRTDRFTGWLTTPLVSLEDHSSLVNVEPVK